MGGEPVWIPPQARPLYHAALAHGSNHLVTLVAQARQILDDAGIEDGARVLGPLLQASLDNALASGDGALTGPVARGDSGTVATHLRALAPLSGDLLPTYAALARATAHRAERTGRLRPDQVAEIVEQLEDP